MASLLPIAYATYNDITFIIPKRKGTRSCTISEKRDENALSEKENNFGICDVCT